jgi:integrase/recombinase XerD
MNVPMKELRLAVVKQNYMLDNRAARLSPKTLRAYSDTLQAFIKFTGDITVLELAPDHLRQYIAQMIESCRFSPHTVAKHYAVIRTWVRWMYAQKIIADRITDYVKPPRLPKTLPSNLSDAELEQLFSGIGNFRDRVVVELFLDTGLRLADVAGLDVGDVNIDGGWVRVVGKGDVEAVVPMGRRLCRDMHTYLNLHRNARQGEKSFFVTREGERFRYEGISTMVRRLLGPIRAPGTKHGAHVLRHTAGTNLVRAGANLETVRRVLRHSDIKTTQIYVHLADEDVFADHRQASPVDHLPNPRK